MKWPTKTLDQIFEIARGGSPRPIQKFITDADDGVNWIMISDATNSSKYIKKTKKKIKAEGIARSRLVAPGDFLLTNSMSFGRPYILDTHGCIHDGWLVLSPREANVDHSYFYHLLSSTEIYSQFEKLAAGATVKNLNIDLVKSVSVSLPPLAEQKRIAAILDQADELRRKRKQALDRLNQLGQAIFYEMFGDPSSNPKQWPIGSLGDLVVPGDKINYGVVQPGEEIETGVPLVRVGDLLSGFLDANKMKRIDPDIEANYTRSRLNGDEILIGCVGSIGTVALAHIGLRGANIARAVARIPVDPHKAVRAFVAEQLKSSFVQNYFIAETRTVAQPTLNIGLIVETPVFLPPIAKQYQFAERIKKISTALKSVADHRELVNSLFSSLQQRAFRGEL